MITIFLNSRPIFNPSHTRNLMMNNANQVNKPSSLTPHKATNINDDSKSANENINTNETWMFE
jgi:hypothetical protein